MLNLDAELAENLKVYADFTKNRAAVEPPKKLDVPMVWDLYMDTAQPVGGALSAPEQADYRAAPLAAAPAEFGEETAPAYAGWEASGPGGDLLGQINDRLKTQARRYPHPITNEMEALS